MPLSSERLATAVLILAACVAWVALAEVLDARHGGLEPARRRTLVRVGGAVVLVGSLVLVGDWGLEHVRHAARAAEVHAASPLVVVAYALRLLGA